MPHDFDDFDTQIQPEELQCDNPIDSDFEPFEQEVYEGEDYNNWEEQQLFLDREEMD